MIWKLSVYDTDIHIRKQIFQLNFSFLIYHIMYLKVFMHYTHSTWRIIFNKNHILYIVMEIITRFIKNIILLLQYYNHTILLILIIQKKVRVRVSPTSFLAQSNSGQLLKPVVRNSIAKAKAEPCAVMCAW